MEIDRMKVYGKIILGLLFTISVSCNDGRGVDNELILKRSYCLDNYEEIMLTIPGLVTEKFYKERELGKFERIRVDTTMSSTLYVKYRFKYKVEDYQMSINNLIIFEPNEKQTKQTYGYYQSIFERGVNSDETRDAWGTKSIGNELSFGEESEAYEYRKEDRVIGYFLMGRTKNLMVYYIVLGSHVEHLNYLNILKQKIKEINQITLADKKL